MFLTAALVALSLFAVPAAMAKSPSSSKALRFTVVKRTAHYDVVRGHHHRFAVRHGAHKVILHGGERYRVVRHTHRYVVLRAVSKSATATPTIISPSSGGFALGVSTTITWTMSAAVSTGYYRVSLKNTVNGASTRLTAGKIPAGRGVTSYSVPWNVTQAVGTYALWVYYYSSAGRVIGADDSDGALSITQTGIPTPTPTPMPTPTPTPTPTATPTATPTSTPTATPTPAPTGLSAGTFDVMDYGAKADGVTDDSPYIQAAVNACYKAGGGTVYLPAGTYRLDYADSSWAPPGIHGNRNRNCSDSVDLLDNVTIRGAGAGQTYVSGTHSLSSVFGATLRSNIGVMDMTIYGGIAAPDFDGVKFYACTNARIENIIAHDLYIGLALYSCIDSTIKNSVAYNCSGFGFTASEAYLDMQVGNNNVVSDCEAYACMDGFRAAGQWHGAGQLRDARCIGTTFLRCNSHDNTRFGFLATYAGNFSLLDCSASGNTSLGALLGGVHTATLHNSAPVTIDTPSTPNWGWMCDNYGLCSGIVVN